MGDDSGSTGFSGPRHVRERLFGPGRKRILSIDGGGVRGIVPVKFIARMEKLLREQTGRRDLVLSDVFDMIAGTSVGSMLATMLAMGMSAEELEAKFRELAPRIFSGRMTIFDQRQFNATNLVNGIRSVVKSETLGSEKLLTGLTIVAKRVDTGSVWVLSNNPEMPYYNDGDDYDGNWRYKLENLVRASTAAPFLFTPAEIVIHTDRTGKEHKGVFIDGGVSPHNNPAVQLLLMAALPSYKLNWTLSPDKLLMISLGTGLSRSTVDRDRRALPRALSAVLGLTPDLKQDIEEAAFAAKTLQTMVSDAGLFATKVMQSFSNPRFSWKINGEIGSLDGQLLVSAVEGLAVHADQRGLLRFQRYDVPLEQGGLVHAAYDVTASQAERRALRSMDDPAIIEPLAKLATEAARKQVSMEDFEGFVCLKPATPVPFPPPAKYAR